MIPTSLKIEPVGKETVQLFISLGKKSYRQHYLHLWEHQDPSPYFNESFTEKVLHHDLKNKNVKSFIIYWDNLPAGIFKILIDQEVDKYSAQEALLLQKVYLLKEYSGKGIGRQILTYTENLARARNKKIVWLDTMKKGPAINFYLKNGFQILNEFRHKSPEVLNEQSKMHVMIKKL